HPPPPQMGPHPQQALRQSPITHSPQDDFLLVSLRNAMELPLRRSVHLYFAIRLFPEGSGLHLHYSTLPIIAGSPAVITCSLHIIACLASIIACSLVNIICSLSFIVSSLTVINYSLTNITYSLVIIMCSLTNIASDIHHRARDIS